ncbi:MAG: hypothetical protein R3B51_08580 [Thermodesulfobacteriota bacterium]
MTNPGEGQLGTLGNAVLKIDKLDDKTIEGQISTPEKSTFSDYTFAIDAKFKAALGRRNRRRLSK